MARIRFLDLLFGVGGPLSRFRKPIKLDEEYPENISSWAKELQNDVERSTSELAELREKYQVKGKAKKSPTKKPKPGKK